MTVWKGVILETQQSEASHLQGAFSVSTRHYGSKAIWLILGMVVQFPWVWLGSLQAPNKPNLSLAQNQQAETALGSTWRERHNTTCLFEFVWFLRHIGEIKWERVHAVPSHAPGSTSGYKRTWFFLSCMLLHLKRV